MKKLFAIAVAVLSVAGPAGAAEAPPSPPTAADISGARSLSIAASRGLAGGNEGIFLNAASLAARRRYSLELQWALDRVGGENRNQFLGGSIVDSQTAGVTGGVGYTRIGRGATTGDVYAVALATQLSPNLFAGATGKFLRLSGADATNAATADASLFYALPSFSWGVSGYNLVPTANDQQAPMGVGTGIAIGNERRFNVTADYRADFDRRAKTTHSWAVGGEVLAFGNFPVRAGFLRDETRGGRWWSAGVGVVSTTGLALDLAYQQSVDVAEARVLAVGLKMFLLAQ